MLVPLHEYADLVVRATDGSLGALEDVLFDDGRWAIRYVVVNAKEFDRKVAISPMAIGEIDWSAREVAIRLSLEQIKNGPDLLATPEIPRTREQEYASYHGYPAYWGGPALWAWAGAPGALAGPPRQDYLLADGSSPALQSRHHQDDLRSMADLRGAHLYASDGGLGHIEDVMVDHQSWHVPYVVIDIGNWMGGQIRLVPTANIALVDWTARAVQVDTTRLQIEAAPTFDLGKPLDRAAEQILAGYHRQLQPRTGTTPWETVQESRSPR